MKRILKYMGVVASVALMATSCDVNQIPSFDDDDAFVAFGSTTYTFSEQAGTVQIPVTLASVAGISTSIAYIAEDGTAVEGLNYSLVDPSATLSFSSSERTAYVDLNIIDLAGEFTGDVKFTLSITNTGSVNAGTTSSCTITIEDMDHPLSAILGSYYTAPYSYFYADAYQWNFTLAKDESDTSLVWITGLVDAGDVFYGTVNEDCTEIYISLGQTSLTTYYGYPLVLYGITDAIDVVKSGNLTLTITDDGSSVTLSSTDLAPGLYIDEYGYYWDVLVPPFSAVKVN